MAPRATMGRALSRKHHTVAMASPSSYVKQRVLKAARAGLIYLQRACIVLGASIVWLVGLLRYMNVLPGLLRFMRPVHHLRKRQYEPSDSVTYVSGLRDRIVFFLSTESTNKRRILRWVSSVVPSLQTVTDLAGQWNDGLALCVLIEAVAPGSCPRSDLLQTSTAQQRVNNCRLALRLVQRNLGIREPMSPDEMANPSRSSETKLLAYLISIRNASRIEVGEAVVPVRPAEAGAPIDAGLERECSASGSGLVVAVVGKRARFTLTTQDYKYKNLYVTIAGPNGEKVRRKIAASKAGRRALVLGGAGGASDSQSSRDEPQPPCNPADPASDNAEPIPLDYQSVKPGAYQVSYIPRSLGTYQVAITWGGEHIKNSPFRVRSTTAKNIERTSVRPTPAGKGVSFHDHGERPDEEREEKEVEDLGGGQAVDEGPVTRARRQSLVRQSHVLALRDSYESVSTSPYSSMCSSMVSSVDQGNDAAFDVFLPHQGGGATAAAAAGPGPHHLQHQPRHPLLSRHNSSASTASSRSGSIMSRSSSILQGAVSAAERSAAGVKTRRKVIRRIIRGAGGTEEEVVTYPSGAGRSPSAFSSSMSSLASSRSVSTSVSVDERSPKFSTSSSASSVSAVSAPPAHRPRPARSAEPRELYAAQTSAAVLRRACREAARCLAGETPARRADGLDETRKEKDRNLKADGDETATLGGMSAPSDAGASATIDRGSPAKDRSVESNPQSLAQAPAPPKGASDRKETSDAPTAAESAQPGQPSADLQEYLTRKAEFLRSLGGDSVARNESSPTKTTPVGNGDGSGGAAPGRTTAGQASRGAEAARPTGRRSHKKRREDKATQCTAQDIKTATGWVSRRSGHRGAKPGDGRPGHGSAAGRGDRPGTTDDDSGGRPGRSRGGVAERSGRAVSGSHGGGASSRRADPDQRRRRPGQGQVRQSTFDSGFSDENAQAGQEARRSGDEARGQPPRAPSTDGGDGGGPKNNGQPSNPSSSDPSSHGNDTGAASASFLDSTRSHLPEPRDGSAPDQYVPIEIVPPTPTAKHETDFLEAEQAGVRQAAKVSSDEETDRGLGSHTLQCLRVDVCRAGGSTVPTPGDSSEGNISSSDAELPAATSTEEGGRSHASSGSCGSDAPGRELGQPAGPHRDGPADGAPAEGARAREGVGAKNVVDDELSLDALLRTLENDPDYSTREFLRKYQPVATAPAGLTAEETGREDPRASVAPCSTDWPGGTGQKGRSLERAETATGYNDGLSNDGSLASPSQPLPERCHASGVGLYHGIVGEKNNFQVRTVSAGDGSLSVTVRGPRPHTVIETNMLYTGDDLYEVIYDVSLAGFYVISVKWADRHIPDSPFIVKVVF